MVTKYQQYKKTVSELAEAREMLEDVKEKELEDLVKSEIAELSDRKGSAGGGA